MRKVEYILRNCVLYQFTLLPLRLYRVALLNCMSVNVIVQCKYSDFFFTANNFQLLLESIVLCGYFKDIHPTDQPAPFCKQVMVIYLRGRGGFHSIELIRKYMPRSDKRIQSDYILIKKQSILIISQSNLIISQGLFRVYSGLFNKLCQKREEQFLPFGIKLFLGQPFFCLLNCIKNAMQWGRIDKKNATIKQYDDCVLCFVESRLSQSEPRFYQIK